MSSHFSNLFTTNSLLGDADREQLVLSLGEFLTFDNLFENKTIAVEDLGNLLSQYGPIWVSLAADPKNEGAPSHLIVNDFKPANPGTAVQLQYYDPKSGLLEEAGFAEFIERVKTATPSEKLSRVIIRLRNVPFEGASSGIKDPHAFFKTAIVNNKSRIGLWRQYIRNIVKEEYKFWAVDPNKPDDRRNTEETAFDKDEPASDYTKNYSDVLKFGLKSTTINRDFDAKKITRAERDRQLKEAEEEILDSKGRHLDLLRKLEAYDGIPPSNLRYAKRIIDYNATLKQQLITTWYYITDHSPWSACFISYVMKQAFLQTEEEIAKVKDDEEYENTEDFGFKFSGGHSAYTMAALANRLNRDYSKPFWLFRLDEKPVNVGDLIVKARPHERLDFDTQLKNRLKFTNGKWVNGNEYFSHADVVIKIEEHDGKFYAVTTGGNTRDLTGAVNTVGRRRYLLDENKRVMEEVDKDYETHNDSSPWALIHIIDEEITTEWKNGNLSSTANTFKEIFGESAEDKKSRKIKVKPKQKKK